MKVDVDTLRMLATALILLQLVACSPEPDLVYSYDTPDLDTPDGNPVPELHEGDDARVTLRAGGRFEARYRGIDEGILAFEDVEWKEPSDRESAAEFRCALEDVSEIRRTDWGTADTVVAVASVAGLVAVLAIYGRGDGGE